MKQPSRFMPEYPLRRPGVIGWLVAVAYVVLFVWLIAEGFLKNPLAALVGVAAVLVVVGVSVRHGRARAAALRDLSMRRIGQSICDFARDFDSRDIDTWVIRAVYEQLQQYLKPVVEQFPVRADDELVGKLVVDPDDLDMDLAVQRECLDFCVMSHTLPERARSRYGEEHNRGIFEGAIGSAVSGT